MVALRLTIKNMTISTLQLILLEVSGLPVFRFTSLRIASWVHFYCQLRYPKKQNPFRKNERGFNLIF